MAFEGHFGDANPPYSKADKAVMGQNSPYTTSTLLTTLYYRGKISNRTKKGFF